MSEHLDSTISALSKIIRDCEEADAEDTRQPSVTLNDRYAINHALRLIDHLAAAPEPFRFAPDNAHTGVWRDWFDEMANMTGEPEP
jgi:hypothetical protein